MTGVFTKSSVHTRARQFLNYQNLYCHGESCVQQEEDSLYLQIGLKFEEETSKMLHLEHGFVWC
jgi:hypothetical protein